MRNIAAGLKSGGKCGLAFWRQPSRLIHPRSLSHIHILTVCRRFCCHAVLRNKSVLDDSIYYSFIISGSSHPSMKECPSRTISTQSLLTHCCIETSDVEANEKGLIDPSRHGIKKHAPSADSKRFVVRRSFVFNAVHETHNFLCLTQAKCDAYLNPDSPCSRCRKVGSRCVISDPFRREHKRKYGLSTLMA